MKPDEFWDCTMSDILLTVEGHQAREIDEWRRTRFLGYLIYCSVTDNNKRESIFNFLPLDGDPSEEELKKIEQQENDLRLKEFEEAYNFYKKGGYLN